MKKMNMLASTLLMLNAYTFIDKNWKQTEWLKKLC